jgi:NAD+ diphosphatase
VIAAGPEPVLLGLDKEAGVFASDLSELSEAAALRLSGASRAVPVRDLFGELSGGDSDVLAYARGLLHWHTQQRFCGRCGSATVSGHGGTIRTCGNGSCGKHHFPRIEPAVIVLVEAPDSPSRCLMARHHGAPEGAYSLLAGFVEVGEGMEHTVAREVHEEAGVTLAEVTYLGSQGWPFPAGLMVGFRARAASASVRTDERELLDARWFTRSEVRERRASPRGLGPADSIGSRMLAEWLAE